MWSTGSVLLELPDLSVVVSPLWENPHGTGQLGLLGQWVIALHPPETLIVARASESDP